MSWAGSSWAGRSWAAASGSGGTPLDAGGTSTRTRTGVGTPGYILAGSGTSTRSRNGIASPERGPTQHSTRWTLFDPLVGDITAFLYNPKEHQITRKRVTAVDQTTASDGAPIIFEADRAVDVGQFQGTLLDQGEYDMFVALYQRRHPLELTDDLGRRSWIYLSEFAPKRVPLRHHRYRMTYTVTYQLLELVNT